MYESTFPFQERTPILHPNKKLSPVTLVPVHRPLPGFPPQLSAFSYLFTYGHNLLHVVLALPFILIYLKSVLQPLLFKDNPSLQASPHVPRLLFSIFRISLWSDSFYTISPSQALMAYHSPFRTWINTFSAPSSVFLPTSNLSSFISISLFYS